MSLDLIPIIGRRAPLVWFVDRQPSDREAEARSYTLDPPHREPSITTLMVVAPRRLDSFEALLSQGQAGREDWLRFLSCCRLVLGDITGDGSRIEVWKEHEAMPLLEALAREEFADEVRPGTGPGLLPLPGGRVPLNDEFLAAIRRKEEFLGLAGGQVDGGSIHLWAVPQEQHLNVVVLFQERPGPWNVFFNPFRIPAGVLYEAL